MNVVLDTNVVVSAIFWPGESRECVVRWAQRHYHLAVTVPILTEYDEIARRLTQRFPAVNPQPWLKWIESKAKVYEPAFLGKQRSSDPDDDLFLACALASGAKIIVSKDRHLLSLEKPFGVEIMLPRQFLQHLG
jgi:putative PIN family toxin of toxin-antitoxin system